MKTKHEPCEGLAIRLIRARNQKNLTSKQLAVLIKCNPSVIFNIEHERNGIMTYTLIKICKALNVTSDYLLGLEDTNARTTKG